jgi:hypothetical protein
MFKVSDPDFDIKTYDGRVLVSGNKISVSGVDLAIKNDGIRPYWKQIKSEGIIYLADSAIKEINSQEVIGDEDLIKRICQQNLRKNIIEKIEVPMKSFIREKVKEISGINVIDQKRAIELAVSVTVNLLPYVENPEISDESRKVFLSIIRGYFDRVKDVVDLYKNCLLTILNAVKKHTETNRLTDEQRAVFDIFLTQFKSNLKLGFFFDNYSNLRLDSFSSSRAIEVVLTPTKRGIEQDLLYVFGS